MRDGTYVENVDVDKSLTIRSENGPENCIVQAASSDDYAFEVTADRVNIIGLTVREVPSSYGGITLHNADHCRIANTTISVNVPRIHLTRGIKLWDSDKCQITGNTISGNFHGIDFGGDSNENIISNNTISGNEYGIYLSGTSGNTIANNVFVNDGLFVSIAYQNKVENNTVNDKPLVYLEKVFDYAVKDAAQVILVNCNNITVEDLDLSNATCGIELLKTDNCRIANNTASNNWYGISLDGSSVNTLTGNVVSNNHDGICLYGSSVNTLTNNTVSDNYNGIRLDEGSGGNTLANNTVSENKWGIDLYYSDGNILTENIASNNWYGICLAESIENIIYLNDFIDNADTVRSHYSTNVWNSAEKITYTYRGKTYTNYLGNYWDDYNGIDINKDGIGFPPYRIDGDKDNYPLMVCSENYQIGTHTRDLTH